jgi:hypothetical protein
MSIRVVALILALLCTASEAQVVSDVTEDGLVRVPSSRKAGVYRLPDAKFAQYRRIILAPATVSISKDPDAKRFTRMGVELKNSDVQGIMNDLQRAFHKELVAELVERGGFALARETALDVLFIAPMISEVDLDTPGSMTLIVELLDSTSGVTVGRIIDFEKGHEPPWMSNIAEARISFANAARYTRSAINIAKTERDETISAPQ